jgi:hypothetical protein
MAAAAAGLRAHWGRPEAHVRRPASVPAAAHSLVADLQAFAGASRAAARREGLERAVRARVMPDCHFAVQLNHFIPDFRSYSVADFLK